MKRRLCLLGMFLILIWGSAFGVSAEELVILHTNDTHSNLFPFGPHDTYGGIARMSTVIKQLREDNENVLALHAGDMFVGTFAFNKYLGYPGFKIMEGLYDAMALGNHEFDLGADMLGYILSGFNPITGQPFGASVALPLLCVNGDFTSKPMLDSFVEPWMIKEYGDLKVGILGVTTPDPIYYSPAAAALFAGTGDPYDNAWMTAGMTAGMLRAMGCQVVIAVSHLGLTYDVLGLSMVPGIDVIVGGHSHDEAFFPNVNGKVYVQAGEFGMNLGELRLHIDDSTGAVTVMDQKLHPIRPEIHKDPLILGYLNELRVGITRDPRYFPVYSQNIAKAMWDHEQTWIDGDPNRDTPVGNLVTDAIRVGMEKAGYPVDCAIEANGYIGHKLYAGKVVGNDLMQVLPYGFDPDSGLGFKMKVVNLAGMELFAALEYTVSVAEYTDELSVQVSGLTFEYDSSVPSTFPAGFDRVDFSSIRINGDPWNPAGLYSVAINEKLVDLLAGLGVDMSLPGRLIEPSPSLLEYNLVKDYLMQLKKLRYSSEGRIIDTSLY